MRISVVLSIAVGVMLWVGAAERADACSCMSGPTDQSLMEQSTTIVVGRAVATTKTKVRVQVLAAWRGADAGDMLEFPLAKSNCELGLVLGFNYLIYTNAKRELSICNPATDVRLPTNENLAALGNPASEVSEKVLSSCPCQVKQPYQPRKPSMSRDTESVAMQTSRGGMVNRFLWQSDIAPYWIALSSLVDQLMLPKTYFSPFSGCRWKEPRTPWHIANDSSFGNVSSCAPPVLVRD